MCRLRYRRLYRIFPLIKMTVRKSRARNTMRDTSKIIAIHDGSFDLLLFRRVIVLFIMYFRFKLCNIYHFNRSIILSMYRKASFILFEKEVISKILQPMNRKLRLKSIMLTQKNLKSMRVWSRTSCRKEQKKGIEFG